ncbi:PilZ domain-containing protein [Ferrimonas senticii]|uniref:PilZ domain-containing protein n=1 Tax=Ferrimonas senticii TaxID=394566 RepID=UPI0003F99337|nr:PilZ domain-containing protein [Ferrimonas senticii]
MQPQQMLIEQLKPILQNPDFDSLFEQITQDLDRSERFLLKMEVTRLNQPSRQSIDLRGKVSGHCEQVEIGGITHFLTRPLALQLQQLLKLYQGRHTVGAVEELLANVRRPMAMEVQLDDDEPALQLGELELMALGHYAMRREVRRTFSTNIVAWQNPNDRYSGITLDLSLGGARIRLPQEMHLSEMFPLHLQLVELTQEFISPALEAGLSYQILEIEQRKGFNYLRLQRQHPSDQQQLELERILQASSLRTVPEITHLLSTVRSHGYERHLLPCLDTITIGYGVDNQQLQPLLAMQCQGNQAALNYWCNERGVSQLTAILSPERIARALKQPDLSNHGLLFSFSLNQSGQTLFFSATLAELQQTRLTDGFLQFACQQPSFRLHRLSVNAVNQLDVARALVNPLNNQRFEPLVQQQINAISLLVTLQPQTLDGLPWQPRPPLSDLNLLRQFGAERISQSGIKTLANSHRDLRREPRFNFNTVVHLSQLGGDEIEGHSINISAHGICIELNQPHAFDLTQPLLLNFVQLQQLAGKIKLVQLPYQVVGDSSNPQRLHLKALADDQNPAQRFMMQLLDQNRDSLGQNSSSKQHQQLTEAIKHLALPRLAVLPMFIHKGSERLSADLLACSNIKLPLLAKLHPDGEAPVQLQWLLQHPTVQQLLAQLTQLQTHQQASLTVAIALPRNGLKAQLFNCQQTPPNQLKDVVVKALAQKRLLVLQLTLCRCDKPDLSYLQHSLAAVLSHAQHRTRKLEAKLWQTRGVVLLQDVSAAMMCQLRLESLLPLLAEQH